MPSLRAFVLALICAVAQLASAQLAPPNVHKVSAPSALIPLTLTIGGRVQTTPANDTSFGGDNYTYQWPGTYFRAAFKGSSVYFRLINGDQIPHITVDNLPPAILTKPQPGIYEVDGLPTGQHMISIFVATESQAAPNIFGGFAISLNETALPPPHRDRQIEFIGDSHTVGYGNLSKSRSCTESEIWSYTDNTSAFGPLTARHYTADYQVNAISGRGVVRNYNGFNADTLPQSYPFTLFDKKQPYNNPSWHPQVIVVALGTNDFSTPLNPGEPWKSRAELHTDYESAYLHFLQQLRAQNADAYLIVWATDGENGEIAEEAQKVVDQMKEAGDKKISFLRVDHLNFAACNFHPSLTDEHIISDKLIHLIDSNHVWQKP